MAYFGDLGKAYSDTYSKDFPNCPKVQVDFSSEKIDVRSSISRNNKTGATSCTFQPTIKVKVGEWLADPKIAFGADTKLDMTLKRKGSDNSEVKIGTNAVPSKSQAGFSVDVKKDWGSASTCVNVGGESTKLCASGVFSAASSCKALVGAQVNYEIKDSAPEYTNATLKVSCRCNDSNVVTASLKNDASENTVDVNYLRCVGSVSAGTGTTVKRSHEGGAADVKVNGVVQYKVDHLNTLKARINSDGVLGLSASQKLARTPYRLVYACEFDLANMHVDSKHSLGVNLFYSD